MKNKHRIKQGLSLLLAGGIALTNLGAALPAFAEDAPATPENAEAATPESAAPAERPAASDGGLFVEEIQSRMYPSLPQTATGYYLDSNGLPVLTGETKISIEGWGDEDYRDYDADSTIQVALDEALLNTDSATASFPRIDSEDYAIVPISIQVLYPANGSSADITLPDNVELLGYSFTSGDLCAATEEERQRQLHYDFSEGTAYCNHETLGQLTIRKLGNVLTDYKDGQFIYTQDNLAGAVYEIHAAADIATPDRQGTYWYKDGDLVATVTTGAEGQVDEVKFSPTRTQATYDFLKITHDGTKGEVTVTLPLGKYTITEVQAPYGFVLTQQSYTVEFGWDNQKNDIVLAKTIVSHEQDGDKKCSYSIVNVKDASDAHKNGQTLVFENARVLPTPEKPGDKVSKIGVGIYKKDREALTYLAGAVYELYTVDDIFSADGTKLLDAGAKLAESSPTNESGFTWFDVDIPIRAKTYPDSGNSGRYRIVEITAPAGYLLDSTPMEVAFTYEGQQIAWQVVDGTNTNLRTTVDISKQDITNGKELPDAKLEIRDADGNLVEGWTSTKTPHTVRGLELEKAYTLTETRAPDGYAEAESIVFKLVQNGTEQVNEVYVKSDDDWVKLDDATVIMQDAPVLDIDKTDIAGNLLPGATLTIRDANDEVVDTWTTDYKTHRVPISDEFIKLSGEIKEYIYTLTEDAAPAGFEIAESVQFKLETVDDGISLFVRENADAEWARADKRLIQMIDEATPREDTPTPTPTPAATPAPTPAPTPVITPRKVQTLPQTGDGFPLLAIVVLSLASATGIVLLTVKQKNALKKTSDEEDADESADR